MRVTKDDVDSPSLGMLKSCLDFALDNLHLVALLEQGLDQMTDRGSF